MIDMTQLQQNPTPLSGYNPQPQAQSNAGGYTATTQGNTNQYQTPWRPGAGAQPVNWSQYTENPNVGQNVQQNWQRVPGQWGGHVIWNPYWGFQDFPTVANLYNQAGAPVTRNQMLGWDLTQQPGPDWQQYFPDRPPSREQAGGEAGGNWTGNWLDYFTQPQGEGGQGWMEGFTMPEGQGQFQYPWQWGQASDVYSRFAQGLPTSTEDWWQAQQAPFERTISDQAKQLAEQMGLGGLRYSTPMTYGIADITGRETGNLYANLATQQLGLTEAAKNRGMQAAGGLAGLGQQYLNAPQDWAQQMYQMGAGMTGLGQSALDRAYQDWMRMTPEYNPWFGQSMGFMGLQNQMMPQQYQPSFLSQLLGGLMGGAGIAGGLGWNPLARR